MPRPSALRCLLRDQVRVVALDRVMHEAEVTPFATRCEGVFELAHEPDGAQRRKSFADLQGHVTRKSTRKRDARAVPDARARAGLPSGARSSTAMSDSIQVELFGFSTHVE
jgi:hypothetical protein